MNRFVNTFKHKSKKELKAILEKEEQYMPDAIIAARSLLNGDDPESIKTSPKSIENFVFPTDKDSFPQFRYVGYAGLIAGVIAMSTNIIAGIIITVFFILLVSLLRPEKRVLDLNNKRIFRKSLFGTNPKYFKKIKGIEIKSVHKSQRLTSRGTSNTIRYELFQAVLLADDKRILLGESKNKNKLLKILIRIQAVMDIRIEDKTSIL